MEGYLVGIDVGGTNIKIMIMDDSYHVLDQVSIKTRHALGYDKISDNIIFAIDRLFEQHQIKDKKILSIGMGLPGIVDAQANQTICLSFLHWDGFNPCEKLSRYYQCAAFIDNDANVNVLGEYYFGIQKKVSDVVLITLGTGVGCGIISNGDLFRGARNLAAELGHMTVEAGGGETCLCGRKGHLEAYCSGTALQQYAKRKMEEEPNTVLHQLVKENGGQLENHLIDQGVYKKDPLCIRIMERYTRYLSIGVANVMTLFNPELILLGGGVANAGDLLLIPVNAQTRQMVLDERQHCPVQKARLGDKAGMYGACAMAGHSIGIELVQ